MLMQPPMCAQLVLCVPGPWEDAQDFMRCIAAGTGGGYRVAAGLLTHAETGHVFEVQFEPRDERVRDAFDAAGRHWRGSPDMERIVDHRSVVYLLGHGGSDQNVHAFMLAAQALLDADGYGVKVESSGLAHPPDDWREMCAALHLFSPFRAFVLVVTDPGEASSCGMHTFGMYDVRVVDADEASALLAAQKFSWYLYTERPAIRPGQTFSCDAHAPVYRIHADAGIDYEYGSLFTNPFGTWRLERI